MTVPSPVLAGLASLLALAGCIGSAPPADLAAPSAGAPVPEAPAEVVETWSGQFMVGAAYELPAHFPETAGAVAPLWPDQMRTFDITEAPQALRFVLEWSGAPGTQLQLMVEGPGEEPGVVNQWVDPEPFGFSMESPLCVPVPAEELRAGPWLAMPHALAGADIRFTLTVTMLGGAGAFHEGHEGWASLPGFAQYAVADAGEHAYAADACTA